MMFGFHCILGIFRDAYLFFCLFVYWQDYTQKKTTEVNVRKLSEQVEHEHVRCWHRSR